MAPHLYMIERSVGDFAGSVAWYAAITGLKPAMIDARNSFAMFEAGPIRFALRLKPSPQSSDLIHFEVADLEAEQERLAHAGIKATTAIQTSDEGYNRLIYADPDGQRICLFEWIGHAEGWDM